jgi:hypothetical protein
MEVFKKLKYRLTFSEVLRYFDPNLSYKIKTDASDGVMAGVFF